MSLNASLPSQIYDFYLVMAPDDSDASLGVLELMLLKSGLRYARHIGRKDGMGARRDIKRLLGESAALLYVSSKNTNALEVSHEAVRRASEEGLDITVIRVDDSPYPSEIARELESAKAVFDGGTTDESRRKAYAAAIRELGGRVDDKELSTDGSRPTTPEANPTAGPQTTADIQEDLEQPIQPHRTASMSFIIIAIILAIVVIAGVIALS